MSEESIAKEDKELQETICKYLVNQAMPSINNLVSNGAPCQELSSMAFYLGEFYVQMSQAINSAEMSEAIDFVMFRIDPLIYQFERDGKKNHALQLLLSIKKVLEQYYKEVSV